MFLHKQERIEGLVFVAMLALLVYTILELMCRRAGQWITARQVLEEFELLGAVYLQFGDGSVLKLPSALNAFQGQLIELLRFPDPAVHLTAGGTVLNQIPPSVESRLSASCVRATLGESHLRYQCADEKVSR